MSIRDKTLRNTALASVGIYTEYFLGMVASILVARHLGPTDYGMYSLIIWLAGMGVVFTNSGITTGLIKFIAELRGSTHEEMIAPLLRHMRRVQLWHLVAVLGGTIALFLAVGDRLVGTLNLTALALLVFAIGLRASYMFYVAVAKGYEAFDVTAKVAMVAGPLNLLLVAVAVWFKGPIEWFLGAYAASSVVFFVVSRWLSLRLVGHHAPRTLRLPEALRRRVSRHLRIVSVTVVVSFLIASDVELLFLKLYDSAASMGYFKVAYVLAKGVTALVPGVISAVLLPMMALALSQSWTLAGQRFVAMTTYMALVAAPLAAFGVVFAGPLIGLLYGEAYAAAVPVFAFCMIAANISMLSQGATSLLVSADRQNTILKLVLAFGAFKIVLDIALIMHFGLTGAVAAIMIESVLSSLAFVLAASRISGVSLEWARLCRITLAATAAASVAAGALYVPMAPLPTLLLGGVLLVVSYAVFSLVFRCWSSADINQLQGLHQRFAAGRPEFLARLLGWSVTHARRTM